MEGWAKIRPASKYAGVSERTLRDWLKYGLRHSRPRSGGTILIKYKWIDEFLERFEVKEDQNLDHMVEGVVSEVLAA